MAGLIGALIGPQAIGFMQNGNAPTAVTVDIGQVMENLNQRADAMRRIEALRSQRKDIRDQFETKLKGLDAEFTAAAKAAGEAAGENGTVDEAADAALRKMRNDLVHHALRFESWMAYANERIDHEASLLMRDLYRSVQAELAVMAQASGFSLVLRDDSIDDIPVDRNSKVPQEMQVMQAISSGFIPSFSQI